MTNTSTVINCRIGYSSWDATQIGKSVIAIACIACVAPDMNGYCINTGVFIDCCIGIIMNDLSEITDDIRTQIYQSFIGVIYTHFERTNESYDFPYDINNSNLAIVDLPLENNCLVGWSNNLYKYLNEINRSDQESVDLIKHVN